MRVSYPPRATTSSVKGAWIYTTFDACVVMAESTNNRYADNGSDESYYQWLPSTWRSAQTAAGVWFSYSPFDASLAQQTYVFNVYEPSNRTAWPNTVPRCGG